MKKTKETPQSIREKMKDLKHKIDRLHQNRIEHFNSLPPHCDKTLFFEMRYWMHILPLSEKLIKLQKRLGKMLIAQAGWTKKRKEINDN